MIVYIDNSSKCHVNDDGTMQAVECDFFDGKCKEFIEGYCCNVDGDNLTVWPWKSYELLVTIQNAVDRTQAEADAQISTLLDTIEDLILGG